MVSLRLVLAGHSGAMVADSLIEFAAVPRVGEQISTEGTLLQLPALEASSPSWIVTAVSWEARAGKMIPRVDASYYAGVAAAQDEANSRPFILEHEGWWPPRDYFAS